MVGTTGAIKVSFLLGKGHVVPLDSSRSSHHGSVTRLEMVGGISGLEGQAVMRGSLTEEELNDEEETWFWTDSCCLLRQVNDPTASHPAFVANRLSKIWKDSKPSQWRFVDGERNPANLISRGIQAHKTAKWKTYLEGPDFLGLLEEEWPQMKIDLSVKESATTNVVEAVMETEEELTSSWWYSVISGISTWQRKIGVMATLMKVAKIWLLKMKTRRGRSTTKEIEDRRHFFFLSLFFLRPADGHRQRPSDRDRVTETE